MLYVYHGSNTMRVADQANALVSNLLQKRADAQVFTFEGGAFEEGALDELVEARGLFVEKHIVVFKQPLETSESAERLLTRLENLALSNNIFVVAEGVLGAKEKKALTKYAEKIEEHAVQGAKEGEFNVFALADALGARKRKELWLLYMRARHNGIEGASLLGTLHWAVRGMLLAARSSSASDAGQKPFVFSKFKRFAANYGEEELVELSRRIMRIYHEARRGRTDIDNSLEQLTLTV